MPSAQPPQPVWGANAATVVGMEGEDDASASLSPADASRRGKAAEHLIAAFCGNPIEHLYVGRVLAGSRPGGRLPSCTS